MSEDELTRYARVPIRARPGCVIGDIKLILEMMALRVESKTFLNVVGSKGVWVLLGGGVDDGMR